MAIIAMVTVVFINNTFHAIRLLPQNRKPMYVLNLIQSLLGSITNVAMIITFFYYDQFCGVRIYSAATLNLISTLSIELILLLKAFYGSGRSKTILLLGVVCETIRMGAGILNLLQMKPIATSLRTCETQVSAISVVSTELLVNGFSLFFLIKIYSQWKFTRTRLYATLLTDGTAYCLGTVLVSTVMIFLAMSNILEEQSSIFFNISWVTASKLTSEQLKHTHKMRKYSAISKKETEPSGKDSQSNNSPQCSYKLNHQQKQRVNQVTIQVPDSHIMQPSHMVLTPLPLP
ncbi:hypothetical protein K7432_011014 [Basidiobolus ranarum]|uniref:Uncharacterized protein n=1 Tax=Basidiobolus ranarum TaxID=34480 RepID=A0ABR2VV24_9FUNG